MQLETDSGTFVAAETTFEQLCGGRAQEIEMFPNPSSSQLSLRVKEQKTKDKVVTTITAVRIYDKLGNLMLYRNVEGGSKQVSLDISRLPADIYKVEVWDKNKKVTLTHRKN